MEEAELSMFTLWPAPLLCKEAIGSPYQLTLSLRKLYLVHAALKWQ